MAPRSMQSYIASSVPPYARDTRKRSAPARTDENSTPTYLTLPWLKAWQSISRDNNVNSRLSKHAACTPEDLPGHIWQVGYSLLLLLMVRRGRFCRSSETKRVLFDSLANHLSTPGPLAQSIVLLLQSIILIRSPLHISPDSDRLLPFNPSTCSGVSSLPPTTNTHRLVLTSPSLDTAAGDSFMVGRESIGKTDDSLPPSQPNRRALPLYETVAVPGAANY